MGESVRMAGGNFENLDSDRFPVCRNACVTSYMSVRDDESMKSGKLNKSNDNDGERFTVKIFNT